MKIKKKLKRLLSFVLTVCLLFGATVGIRPNNLTAEVTAATIDTITSQDEYNVPAGII